MKDESYAKIKQAQTCLSILGEIRSRALFGGYSLSIDDTIFAMVAEGEMYLRACEQSAEYYQLAKLPMLSYTKRGRTVQLNYYRVDDSLWQDPPQLMRLSAQALEGARREKAQRASARRLKDLPNINSGIENMLLLAGIRNVDALYRIGAKRVWIRVRKVNRRAGAKLLFALVGAITGQHEAVLPMQTRRELQAWVKEQIALEKARSGN
ncbi:MULTISPECIES: TfoX/Sxy family DNA transformation protein [Tenebrionibacter/Tenebrionicola group]|jgi:DNA transformation protein|uniref:TfoX/Sxy family DNA transformation protein n=2 Tax=Tenebrionibacter/Tenebrionicola group TaxID=2969848 RepID=A0A8K0V399_9ENTR|nr:MULTISPECIES: TfoX/Sxy family DNA transformation protein [Tenebrionibacter/Tenebrionicola group]MBK4716288.1 TfoX/Sxy family DNA transformation protein [Tenebrionibacter intestinalis]MBV5097101.1 TfoX/Sxy family DNA transformation protein [Tenebrionicola larvae]